MLGNRKKIKTLICDDSAFSRVMLRRIIESDPGIQVVDIARNGEEAIEKAIRLQPDVITLDLHMPVVDGLTALKEIVRLKIAPVIMLSAATPEDAQATMEAMGAGAFDFIVKPDEIQRMDVHSAAIIQKLKQAAASNIYDKLQKNQQPKKKNDKVSFLSSFPPFLISMVTQPGSSCSMTPLEAQKPPGHKDISTQPQVSPPSCLCVLVAPYK